MERFLHKDHLLLGHGPRRSFASPQIPFRNSSSSDVDFNDVFGGPPRRSSMNYDWRQGFGPETEDSQVFRGRGGGEEEEEEETATFRDPWTGLSEKPVFGEERLNRRRRQTNDFYDDIFRGEEREPLSSMPKKPGLDSFSSTPASRIPSPARPLPPQTEPFLSSCLPPFLCLQGKYTKEMDFPASGTPISSSCKNRAGDLYGLGSPISSSTTVSRFSPQVILGEDGSRNDPRALYRQTSLSKDFSLNKFETTDQEGLCKKKSNMSHINNSSGQFHFSVYKWASKGVPIAMLLQGRRNSSRSKESSKVMNSGPEEHAPVSLGVQLSSISENNLEAKGSFRSECANQDYTLVTSSKKNNRIDSSQSVEEVSSAKPESKSVTNLQGAILETPCNLVPHNTGKEIRPSFGAPLNVYSSIGTATEKLVSNKEEHKPELKPLHCLFKDESTRQGNVNSVEQPRVKEGKGRSTHTSIRGFDANKRVITCNGKILNLKKENNSKLRDSATDSEEKPGSDKVKGKVKEFVKIFCQEAPVKPLNNTGSGVIEKNILKVEDRATLGATRADMEEQLINATDNGKLKETTIMVDQTLKESAKPPPSINSTAFKIDDASNGGKDSSLSCSGSIQSFESGIGNIEESHIADLHCQVEELPHEEVIRPQNRQIQGKIQDSDSRIRHWSTGKEGNIRSLLSTLQYVLWPESGWKPVPLVDIIEGNSVKRVYQKALLCLHPDKLQQKGAEPHQKYIAGKVFDILQEAWTHFNALGSF